MIIDSLKTRYDVWKELEDNNPKQKRLTLNHIMPIIALCSLLIAVMEVKEDPAKASSSRDENDGSGVIETLREIMNDFEGYLQTIFPGFNSELGNSDFSATDYQKIDQYNQKDGGKSREDLQEMLAILDGKSDKYEHAHVRVVMNFGDLLRGANNKEQIKVFLESLNIKNFTNEHLLRLLKELQGNVFEKSDDLEKHALLNQWSSWVDMIMKVSRPNETLKEFEDFLMQNHNCDYQYQYQEMQKECDKLLSNAEFLSAKQKLLNSREKPTSKILVGIEIEFNVKDPKSEDLKDPESKDRVKKALADVRARAEKEQQYLGQGNLIYCQDVVSLIKAEGSSDEPKKSHAKQLALYEIRRDLVNYLYDKYNKRDDSSVSVGFEDKFNFCNENEESKYLLDLVEKLSNSELLFYKLLILDPKYNIEIPGVTLENNDVRDRLNAQREKIIELIREGRFYENLLDMIEANEIAYGPFPIEEAIQANEDIVKWIQHNASQIGVEISPPNVQINLSVQCKNKENILEDILLPKAEGDKLKISPLAVKILEKIQEILSAHPHILRSSNEVTCLFDRMKNIKNIYGDTIVEAYQGLDMREEKKDAFRKHRKMAAKDCTLRLSATDKETGVAEVRCIGGNPHFALCSGASKTHDADAKQIVPPIIAQIQLEIDKIIKDYQNAAKLTPDLSNQMLEKTVTIQPDGKIDGLDPVVIQKKDVEWKKKALPKHPGLKKRDDFYLGLKKEKSWQNALYKDDMLPYKIATARERAWGFCI